VCSKLIHGMHPGVRTTEQTLGEQCMRIPLEIRVIKVMSFSPFYLLLDSLAFYSAALVLWALLGSFTEVTRAHKFAYDGLIDQTEPNSTIVTIERSLASPCNYQCLENSNITSVENGFNDSWLTWYIFLPRLLPLIQHFNDGNVHNFCLQITYVEAPISNLNIYS